MPIFSKGVVDNSITLEKYLENLELQNIHLDGEPLPLDDLSSIHSSGIPAELAIIIRKHNTLFGETMTTIRVGTHPHHDMPRASKPLTVHSKTINHGFLYGYICTEDKLAKIDNQRKILKGALDKEDIEKHTSIQLKLTLREIFRSLSFSEQEVDMEIVRVVPGTSILVLKYRPGKGPENFTGEFYINLKDDAREVMPHRYIMGDPNILKDISIEKEIKDYVLATESELNKENVKQCLKTFLDDNKNNYLDMAFPIYYKKDLDNKIEHLNVLSEDDKPITGDWDIDSESIPLGFPEYVYKPINTMHNIDQQRWLLIKTQELFDYIKSQILNGIQQPDKRSKIADSLLGKLIIDNKDLQFLDIYFADRLAEYTGNITPFEFLQNITRNYFYRDMVDSSIACIPLQHGSETNSPFKGNSNISPDSGGPRMHIYKDYIFYTANEEQRVQLCLVKGFLENNYPGIPPWPAFSMTKWHPVIEKQIRLGQKIPKKIMIC